MALEHTDIKKFTGIMGGAVALSGGIWACFNHAQGPDAENTDIARTATKTLGVVCLLSASALLAKKACATTQTKQDSFVEYDVESGRQGRGIVCHSTIELVKAVYGSFTSACSRRGDAVDVRKTSPDLDEDPQALAEGYVGSRVPSGLFTRACSGETVGSGRS